MGGVGSRALRVERKEEKTKDKSHKTKVEKALSVESKK
jgi:hypothetical protein